MEINFSPEGGGDVKPPEIRSQGEIESQEKAKKELLDKLSEIFDDKDMGESTPEEAAEKPTEAPLEDNDRTITLPDGTVIELPDLPKTESNIDGSAESNDKPETNDSPEAKRIKELLGTPDGIKTLFEENPDLKQKWEKVLEVLNDPDATPAEKNRVMGIFKGALMEAAAKKAMSEAGLSVEDKQRTTKGESGDTRPDIIATNNTDKPITVFGVTVEPGESVSVECKCGEKKYLDGQISNHIPNQLSGQEGKRVLVTTNDVDTDRAQPVCDKYDAKLVVVDISTANVSDVLEKGVKN